MIRAFLPLLHACKYADRQMAKVTSGLGCIKVAFTVLTAIGAVHLNSEGTHVVLVEPG
ncbi:hypothetical protein F5Y12DRAFT_713606 [Xylaria sp. FL1777]|nr:hypothetical protein F5Y12DRAFT_713606 [Xylaria sp. FL1777]